MLWRVKIDGVSSHHNDAKVFFNVLPVQNNVAKVFLNMVLNFYNVVPNLRKGVVGRLHAPSPDKIALAASPRAIAISFAARLKARPFAGRSRGCRASEGAAVADRGVSAEGCGR